MKRIRIAALAAVTLAASSLTTLAPAAQAQKINDALNDWAPTYTGPKNGDLDVVSSQVYFDGSRFVFTATMNDFIGKTTGAFYVWGLDKGNGNSPFAANGAPNVKFNQTVILRPTGSFVGGNLVNDFFWISGKTITGAVPAALLPSIGLFTQDQFTWNLWPRATGPAGNAAISDFAPDNGNNALTLGAIPAAVFVTPEPASLVLVGAGLLAIYGKVRRRRA